MSSENRKRHFNKQGGINIVDKHLVATSVQHGISHGNVTPEKRMIIIVFIIICIISIQIVLVDIYSDSRSSLIYNLRNFDNLESFERNVFFNLISTNQSLSIVNNTTSSSYISMNTKDSSSSSSSSSFSSSSISSINNIDKELPIMKENFLSPKEYNNSLSSNHYHYQQEHQLQQQSQQQQQQQQPHEIYKTEKVKLPSSKHCRKRLAQYYKATSPTLPLLVSYPALSKNPRALKLDSNWKDIFEDYNFTVTNKPEHATIIISKHGGASRLPLNDICHDTQAFNHIYGSKYITDKYLLSIMLSCNHPNVYESKRIAHTCKEFINNNDDNQISNNIYGELLSIEQFLPTTYLMNLKSDCQTYMANIALELANITSTSFESSNTVSIENITSSSSSSSIGWVDIRPTATHPGGKAIKLLTHHDILKMYKDYRKGGKCPYAEDIVIQKLKTNIHPTLMKSDRNCNIRTYMYIASTKPLVSFLYPKIILKCHDEINTKIYDVYSEKQFMEILHLLNKDIHGDYFNMILKPKIKRILGTILASLRPKLHRSRGFFALYSVDLILDINLNLSILKITDCPNLQFPILADPQINIDVSDMIKEIIASQISLLERRIQPNPGPLILTKMKGIKRFELIAYETDTILYVYPFN